MTIDAKDLWMAVACGPIGDNQLMDDADHPMIMVVGTKQQCETHFEDLIANGEWAEYFLTKVKIRGYTAIEFDEDTTNDGDEQSVPGVRPVLPVQ